MYQRTIHIQLYSVDQSQELVAVPYGLVCQLADVVNDNKEKRTYVSSKVGRGKLTVYV